MPTYDISARIDALYIHPVKSCAAVAVQSARVTPTGLEHDREWMLVDATGRFVSQRELPRMVLIVPNLTDTALVLKAPECAELEVAFDTKGESVTVQIWDDAVAAIDMGDAAAAWLSAFLGQNLRLVRFDKEHERVCSVKWTKEHHASTMFADGYPILVSCVASFDELNTRLNETGNAPVNARRFRPNILLSGIEAHNEDLLDVLHIENAVQLKNVKPCARCPIPDVNPETAEVNPIVTDTLLTYRRNASMDDQPTFGVNAIVIAGAGEIIRVGDAVDADFVF